VASLSNPDYTNNNKKKTAVDESSWECVDSESFITKRSTILFIGCNLKAKSNKIWQGGGEVHLRPGTGQIDQLRG